ncbi:MAG: sortase [Gaiellales bacterium]
MSELREQVAVEAQPAGAAGNGGVLAEDAPRAEPAPGPPPASRQPAAPPATAPARRSGLVNVMIVCAILGALAGGFLVYEFWLTGLIQSRSQTRLLAEFKGSLLLDDTPALITPPAGQPVGLIQIPTIGVSQVIVQGISSADTKLGPGHDPSTPAPGQAGNAVVIGRRAAYGGPFAKLDQIKQGDKIMVLTRQGLFTYTVAHLRLVSLGDPAMAKSSTASRLTLITSDPPYLGEQEIAVVARLTAKTLHNKGLQVPAPLPLPPPGEKPGLSTDASAWGRILLWGELLIVAIAGTWYLLRRRWSTAVTYLLAAPILIALAFFFYGAIDVLLPPTL